MPEYGIYSSDLPAGAYYDLPYGERELKQALNISLKNVDTLNSVLFRIT